jgi:hypothetical protein
MVLKSVFRANYDIIGPVALQNGVKHDLESIAGNIDVAVTDAFFYPVVKILLYFIGQNLL